MIAKELDPIVPAAILNPILPGENSLYSPSLTLGFGQAKVAPLLQTPLERFLADIQDSVTGLVNSRSNRSSNSFLAGFPAATVNPLPNSSANNRPIASDNTDELLAPQSASAIISPSSALAVATDSATGTLTATDVLNPLFSQANRYKDDFLLSNLQAGQQVTINLNSSAFNTLLQLVDADSQKLITFNDNISRQNTNSELTFTAEAGKRYLVRATSSGTWSQGQYNIQTTGGFLHDAISNVTLQGQLSSTDKPNDLRAGAYYDSYYLNNLTPFQNVQVNLNSSQFDGFLTLINAQTGAVITEDDDGGGGRNSQLNFTAEPGVTYLVRATSYGAGAQGNYSLTVNSFSSTVGQVDALDDRFYTSSFSNNSSNNLVLQGYVDEYSLGGIAFGQDIKINLAGGASGTALELVNTQTNTILASSQNGQLDFRVASETRYTVRVVGPDTPTATPYTLTANIGTLFETTNLTNNAQFTGQLSLSDTRIPMNNYGRQGFGYDGYALNNLTAGVPTNVSLFSDQFDALLMVINARTGQLVALNDDYAGTSNAYVNFTPEANGEYLALATSYAYQETGTYTINVG